AAPPGTTPPTHLELSSTAQNEGIDDNRACFSSACGTFIKMSSRTCSPSRRRQPSEAKPSAPLQNASKSLAAVVLFAASASCQFIAGLDRSTLGETGGSSSTGNPGTGGLFLGAGGMTGSGGADDASGVGGDLDATGIGGNDDGSVGAGGAIGTGGSAG